MSNALQALVVDEAALAEAELARGLDGFVRFTSTGRLLLEPAFDGLSAEHRVLCLLLALQAMRLLGLRDTDHATPGQLSELSGMPTGTVRPKLSALLKARSVVKDNSRYSLPLHGARRAIDLLEAAR